MENYYPVLVYYFTFYGCWIILYLLKGQGEMMDSTLIGIIIGGLFGIIAGFIPSFLNMFNAAKETKGLEERSKVIASETKGLKDKTNHIYDETNGLKDKINGIHDETNDLKDKIDDIHDETNDLKGKTNLIYQVAIREDTIRKHIKIPNYDQLSAELKSIFEQNAALGKELNEYLNKCNQLNQQLISKNRTIEVLEKMVEEQKNLNERLVIQDKEIRRLNETINVQNQHIEQQRTQLIEKTQRIEELTKKQKRQEMSL